MATQLHDPTSRARARAEAMNWKPRNVVWELTLACNLRCGHCGSRAGEARADELTTEEALRVAGELAALGAELVTLSGGEPTLRPDWDLIASALVERGVRVNLVTNGWTRTEADATALARRVRAAGLSNVGVSLDGPEAIHDRVRGKGTFRRSRATLQRLVAEGVSVGVLTTIQRLNLNHLEETRAAAAEAGASMWRLQLGKPMGSLADRPDWTLAPEDLLTLIPRLARMKREPGPALFVGDSLGYYGSHDKVLRGRGWRGRDECWRGCQAGMQALGIESDGGLKGCLSLQAKPGGRDVFREASVRDAPLADLWYRPGMFAYNRDFEASSLTGFCGGCRHAKACRGGARCVSAAFTGALAEDPYCYHRVASLARGEWRRDLVQHAAAAAAVFSLSVGAACGDAATTPGVIDDGASVSDVDATPDAAVSDTVGLDTAAPPADSAVIDTCCETDYGLPPDTITPDAHALDTAEPPEDTTAVDACCETDYGLPPDASPADTSPATDADAVDCTDVCCDCDYGVPPPPECCP
jgi:radical SAM protein with 4Fe4S-binding SPASM domain